jgi:hypothetical protein
LNFSVSKLTANTVETRKLLTAIGFRHRGWGRWSRLMLRGAACYKSQHQQHGNDGKQGSRYIFHLSLPSLVFEMDILTVMAKILGQHKDAILSRLHFQSVAYLKMATPPCIARNAVSIRVPFSFRNSRYCQYGNGVDV